MALKGTIVSMEMYELREEDELEDYIDKGSLGSRKGAEVIKLARIKTYPNEKRSLYLTVPYDELPEHSTIGDEVLLLIYPAKGYSSFDWETIE